MVRIGQNERVITIRKEPPNAHVGLLLLDVWPVSDVEHFVHGETEVIGVGTDATLLILLGPRIVTIHCVTARVRHHVVVRLHRFRVHLSSHK